MSRPAPRAVGDLLSSALPQMGDRLVEFRIRRAWAAVVGRDIARRTRPDGLVNGTLRVVVDNSPWLHELTLRESELASMIRGRFPEVQALKLGLATLGTERAAEATPAPRPVPLTPADRADIDGAVAAIADAEVADTARRLMTTARRFPRSRQPSTPTHAGARGAE